MERVIAALRDAGISRDDLQTEQVAVYPRTSDNGLSIVGYDASNTVSATIRDLGQAGGIVDAAVAAGANQVYGPSLTASDTDAQYRAAVDEAFDDARRRAEAIAEKAGVTLGAPVAIVEGAGGGAMPYYAETLSEEAAADVAVEPGTQDVGATLTVTFAIFVALPEERAGPLGPLHPVTEAPAKCCSAIGGIERARGDRTARQLPAGTERFS